MALSLLLMSTLAANAGVLADAERAVQGKATIASAPFAAASLTTPQGYAVRWVVKGDDTAGRVAKSDLLRAVLAFREANASVTPDSLAHRLFDALIVCDLLGGGAVLPAQELAGMQAPLRSVLDRLAGTGREGQAAQLDGVSGARLAASALLFGTLFPADSTAERWHRWGRERLLFAIREEIAPGGSWKPDGDGRSGDAAEALAVAALVLRNRGEPDPFAHPRLRDLFLYAVKMLPPQQSPAINGRYRNLAPGWSDPGVGRADIAPLVASAIYSYYPNEASYLVWYWNQCGRPVHPLAVLYATTTIPYMRPESGSVHAGGGTVALRDGYGLERESMAVVTYGGVAGQWSAASHHSDHGDISWIWSGIPVMVHAGYTGQGLSDDLANRQGWRHSLVQYAGAGESRVIPESRYPSRTSGAAARRAGDWYPDGVSQFVTTPRIDYVSGPVRLSAAELPIPGHERHVLSIKPDALVIWDRVTAPGPLEWNLWIPAEAVATDGGSVTVDTSSGISLGIHIAGEPIVTVTKDAAPDSVAGHWPLLMQARVGRGAVAVSALDLPGAVGSDPSGSMRSLLDGVLFTGGTRGRVGMVGCPETLAQAYTAAGYGVLRLDMAALAAALPDSIAAFIVDSAGVSEHDLPILLGENGILTHAAERGARVLVVARTPEVYRPTSTEGPGTLPVTVGWGGCPVTEFRDADLRKALVIPDNVFWQRSDAPSVVAVRDWVSRQFRDAARRTTGPGAVPAQWSDRWEVLLAIDMTVPVTTVAHPSWGRPVRLRVRHPRGNGFLTVLIPSTNGKEAAITVRDSGPGYVILADTEREYEVRTTNTVWTDAILSVRVTRRGEPESLYAFDCTTLDLPEGKISAQYPFTLYYDLKDARGYLASAQSIRLSCPRADISFQAGEAAVFNLAGVPTLERRGFVMSLAVTDAKGAVLPGIRVFQDESLVGVTDERGEIPLRWSGSQPQIAIEYRGNRQTAPVRPGAVTVRAGG